jgi:hypothetical protein
MPFLAVAAIVSLSAAGMALQLTASAHTPHPGLGFHIAADTNGDSIEDCGTGPGQIQKCFVLNDTTFTLNIYLDSIGDLPTYEGLDFFVQYVGIASEDNPSASAWPDCDVPNIPGAQGAGTVEWGCETTGPGSTYTGLVATSDFTCAEDASVTLVHGDSDTFVSHPIGTPHAEGDGTTDSMEVNCVNELPPTPTSTTPATPTSPPTNTPTSPPPTATPTVPGQNMGGVAEILPFQNGTSGGPANVLGLIALLAIGLASAGTGLLYLTRR